ncbi:hypothetical protein KSF78_0004292 [Schistosoma japonicum]|nr:hypothetical protein KSF78_0004292 [Schistosoma japonicum]
MIPVVTKWIETNQLVLWVSSGIYLVLQLIWGFVPRLSRAYPYNILYLLLMFDFTRFNIITLLITLFIDLLLLIGQLIYLTSKNQTVLLITGVIAFPFTLLKVLIEIKMILGNGKYRYNPIDYVYTAGVIYNSWWILFVTILWISTKIGLKIEN